MTRGVRWATAAVALAMLSAGCTSTSAPRSPVASSNHRAAAAVEPLALRLSIPRAVHRATLLTDGRVLLTGGCADAGCAGAARAAQAEIYDPGSRQLITGRGMRRPRLSGTATLLADGRVLLVGGYPGEGEVPMASAELFDPQTQRFLSTGDLRTPRADHSATRLADGTVLVVGGYDDNGHALASTEVFDPDTGRFQSGPRLRSPRAAQVAVGLGTSVALVGGTVDGTALRTTEVLRDGVWRQGPLLEQARVKHGAVALDDHRVLVVGGADDTEGRHRLRSTEILDLTRATSVAGPLLAEGQYKLDGAVARLPDGRVLIGGDGRLEIYDPARGRIGVVAAPRLQPMSFRTVTVLSDGGALIAGGYDDDIVPSDAAVAVPASAFAQ